LLVGLGSVAALGGVSASSAFCLGAAGAEGLSACAALRHTDTSAHTSAMNDALRLMALNGGTLINTALNG
jgi:hypothetical protein